MTTALAGSYISTMDMDAGEVMERASVLRANFDLEDRERIRNVMNGGAAGVQAVLQNIPSRHGGKPGMSSSIGIDLPTANFVASGLDSLARRIGRQPSLKTETSPVNDKPSDREAADKRARIVNGWDEMDRAELQYPQIGRWLPGYGIYTRIIKDRSFGPGVYYPVGELRDPYDVFPGAFGVNQQPTEMAIYRNVSKHHIGTLYPGAKAAIEKAERLSAGGNRGWGGAVVLNKDKSWEGNDHNPTEIIEYYCADGTYVVCPEYELVVSMIPNPLDSGPTFTLGKRFAFDQIQSHFHHSFGLMAMFAKLNILMLIAAEDSTFRETNIYGEKTSPGKYQRGRFAVNEFDARARVDKPTSDQLNQTLASINTLERQFRITSGYDVQQDGISPNSFATGAGMTELKGATNDTVREYHMTVRHTDEISDMKRLEWEEKMARSQKKKVFWYEGSNRRDESYVPSKDIAGNFQTKRVFGAMATWDANSKIVTGLQLLQAELLDPITFQENMDDFENSTLVNQRVDQFKAKKLLMEGLGMRFGANDPAAGLALVEIFNDPSKADDTLKKLFTPEEPQMSPEEEAMLAQQGGEGLPPGPPEAVQTVLSQLETAGGGVQTVGRT